jgi:hypothetical protein
MNFRIALIASQRAAVAPGMGAVSPLQLLPHAGYVAEHRAVVKPHKPGTYSDCSSCEQEKG